MSRPGRASPAWVAGWVWLAAVSCGGSPTQPSPGPLVVASVTPGAGSILGGTPIRISGSGFRTPATVQIGGSPASNVVVNSSTSITAVTAAHEPGAVDVSIASGGENATLPVSFTYAVPSTTTNTPPAIVSLAAQGSRAGEPTRFADLGEEIAVTTAVEDAETPPDALTYEWTSSAGVISGTGRAIRWRAPDTAATPLSAAIGLTVIERFTTVDSAGVIVHGENRISKDVTVRVHDSVRELGDRAKTFLELFSQSSVAPDDVMRDFQDGCGAGGTGKRDERNDVEQNRAKFVILDSAVGTPRTTIDFGGVSPFRARRADGWAAVDVMWRSRCLVVDNSRGCPAAGFIKNDVGTDWITAHYDEPTDRWWLCDSDYEARSNPSSAFGR